MRPSALMHPSPSLSTPTLSTPISPTAASTPRRSKHRAFNYLRNRTSSSSNTAQVLNASPLPTHDRHNSLTRSTSHPDPRSPTSTTTTADVQELNTGEQSAYGSWPDSAFQSARLHFKRKGVSVDMARGRSGSAPNGARTTSENSSTSLQGHPQDQMPTIRLIPHQDPRATRPSLAFPPTQRTLPHEDCVIRVGRYSERDTNPNPPPSTPSSAPVGFKSKVVSRRHCEFWCSQGQWYIKDVKSSSGTFLNHIRLSQPSVESRPWPVNDGDVVQLGIDFRGGEEMIFRCVKIRVECNRAWQKTLNNYNVTTHKRLRDLGKAVPKKDSDTASSHSSECSICLMSIAPCQSLFVAPCSHVWHYKCIRPILNDHKTWPQFLCPNCRAVTDLEADVDDALEDNWEEEGYGASSDLDLSLMGAANGTIAEGEEMEGNGDDEALSRAASLLLSVRDDTHLTPSTTGSSDPTNGTTESPNLLARRGARPISPSIIPVGEQPTSATAAGQVQYLRPITPTRPLLADDELDETSLRTPMTDMLVNDGPMTPTNNAGPFVFDGSAGRAAGSRIAASMSEDSLPDT